MFHHRRRRWRARHDRARAGHQTSAPGTSPTTTSTCGSGGSTPDTRKTWLGSLDAVAALGPSTIITGHKDPDAPDDNAIRVLDQSRRYIEDFDQTVAKSSTPARSSMSCARSTPTTATGTRCSPRVPPSSRPNRAGTSAGLGFCARWRNSPAAIPHHNLRKRPAGWGSRRRENPTDIGVSHWAREAGQQAAPRRYPPVPQLVCADAVKAKWATVCSPAPNRLASGGSWRIRCTAFGSAFPS